VLSFFPEAAPKKISPNLAAMRCGTCSPMSTGTTRTSPSAPCAARIGNAVKAFLSLPVEHEPGTHFATTAPPAYMLSTIVQKLTGQTLLDY